MTEVVQYQQSGLAADVEYAKLVSTGAMLPAQYRGKPADILIAMGLGKAMGLSPAESLYRIHVIQGRPTASAELIAANVRKAGHTLRVKGDETSARAVVIRSDDPDFEFESVWNLERAKRLGLSDKDGWKKQPGTMMRWRAITEVARLACPEALYGVSYVREEIEDERPTQTATRPSASDFAPAADVQDAEVVTEEPPAEQPADFPAAQNRLNAMFAEFGRAGFTTDARSAEGRQARLDYCSNVIGRPVESSKDLLAGEVERVINALKADAADDGELPLDPA